MESPTPDCFFFSQEHQCNIGKIALVWWQDPFDARATKPVTRAAFLCQDCAIVNWASPVE